MGRGISTSVCTRRATRFFQIPSQFRFEYARRPSIVRVARKHLGRKTSTEIGGRRVLRKVRSICFDVSVLLSNKLGKNTHLIRYTEVNRIERRYTFFQRITLSLSLTSNNDRLSCHSAHKATSIFDVRRRFFLGGTGRPGLPFPIKVSFRSHTWPHLRPCTFSRKTTHARAVLR